MNDIGEKHRQRAAVFVNADGQQAVRIPDLIPAQCIVKSCLARCYVESPVDAMHCVKCGSQGLRVSKFGQLEPFWLEEPSGAHHALLRMRDDDETNPGNSADTKESP